jgi:mercuric ion binding protein
MKLLSILFALVISVSSLSVNAQESPSLQKENITVYGNCGMCKARIEKAAVKAGAATADWNDETKILAVTFSESKTMVDTIEKAIAAVGHDTKNYSASDEVYNKLHGCCKYERKSVKQ